MRMFFKLSITIIAMGLSCFLSGAQSLTSISGNVIDSETGRAMAAVSVTTGASGVGTVTNQDGKFIIKVPSDADSLIFTYLGYKTRAVRIDKSGNPVKIGMEPQAIPLSGIVVESPENILSAAIENIPVNYPCADETSCCFYRETTQKGSRFIYVAEAVQNLYKTAYSDGIGRDKVDILKGRRLVSPKQSDTLGATIMGGPMTPVFLDIVKNRDFILSKEEMQNYSFALDVPVEIGGRPHIVISFKPKAIDREYPLFFGKYYIDRETLAFSRVEMRLDVSDRRKVSDYILVSKPSGVRFKPLGYEIEVDYSASDVSRLNYLRAEIRFKCDWKRKLFSSPYTVSSEMVVTSRNASDAKPVKKVRSFSRFDSYFDHTEYFKDKSFWGDYNIIAPTERLNDAIDRLVRKNARQ